MTVRLFNSTGDVVAAGTTEQMFRLVKHGLADSDYRLEGPGTRLSLYRIGGIVYPAGGVLDGEVIPPRTKDMAIEQFGVPEAQPQQTARDLLNQYDLDDGKAADALVNGWFGHEGVIEILCDAIDKAGAIDEFAEFLRDNFCREDTEDRREHSPGNTNRIERAWREEGF